MGLFKKRNGYWTLDMCKKEAMKYPTKKDWQINHRSSYTASLRSKWHHLCTKHMTSNRGLCERIKILCSNGKEYESTVNAAKELDLNITSISRVLKKKQKHTNGFTFKYADESLEGNKIQNLLCTSIKGKWK